MVFCRGCVVDCDVLFGSGLIGGFCVFERLLVV